MQTKKINVEIFTGKQTVAQINEWLAKNNVRVINIETISTTTGGGGFGSEVKLIKSGTKVWYEDLSHSQF